MGGGLKPSSLIEVYAYASQRKVTDKIESLCTEINRKVNANNSIIC